MDTQNQGKMPMTGIVVAIAIVILGALGVVFGNWNGDSMKKGDAMMENEGVMEGENMQMEEGKMKMEGDTMMQEDAMDTDGAMMEKGSYEPYSAAKVAMADASHHVVLFFRASWCPTCRALDADIKANLTGIPGDLTILDVDYDKEVALKQKYGVTHQHTLVEVDASGNLVKKWDGSPTLAALVAQI